MKTILMALLCAARNRVTALGFSAFSAATLSMDVMGSSPESVLTSKVSVDDDRTFSSSRMISTIPFVVFFCGVTYGHGYGREEISITQERPVKVAIMKLFLSNQAEEIKLIIINNVEAV